MRRNRVEQFQGHDLDDRFPSGSRRVGAFCADLARPSQLDTKRIETLAAELAAEATAGATPNQHGVEFGRRRRPLPARWRRRAALTALMSSLAAKIAFAAVAVAATTGGLAATGNLPDPAQQLVSEVVGRIGIHIPTPATPLPVLDPTEDAEPSDIDGSETDHTLPDHASERAKWVIDAVFDEDDEATPGPDLGKRVSEIASAGRSGTGDGNTPEGAGPPDVPGPHPGTSPPENPGPPEGTGPPGGIGNGSPGPPGQSTP
jgi:hypothetical protein